MEERRKGMRCPVCQGPLKTDDASGLEKCRNSLCAFNHKEISCPRCQSAEVEAIARTNAVGFRYVCRDCQQGFERP